MVPESPEENFLAGYFISGALHCAGIAFLLLGYGANAAGNIATTEVYTVTLEGGEKLGGISKAPEEDPKKKVLPNINESQPVQEQPKVSEKPPEEPSVIEERKKLEETKAKAEEEKKILEAKKLEEKKKHAEDLKKLEELEKKKAELDQKKKKEELAKKEKEERDREKRERDKALQKAISNATNYKGESANAGGEGLGAARYGGKGMGGGTPVDAQFLMYVNALEQHIKRGWRWLPGAEHYVAQIEFSILPDGTVQNARVGSSSGNSSFDDSGLRAVYKASPVPLPPPQHYERFKSVRITFDSER